MHSTHGPPGNECSCHPIAALRSPQPATGIGGLVRSICQPNRSLLPSTRWAKKRPAKGPRPGGIVKPPKQECRHPLSHLRAHRPTPSRKHACYKPSRPTQCRSDITRNDQVFSLGEHGAGLEICNWFTSFLIVEGDTPSFHLWNDRNPAIDSMGDHPQLPAQSIVRRVNPLVRAPKLTPPKHRSLSLSLAYGSLLCGPNRCMSSDSLARTTCQILYSRRDDKTPGRAVALVTVSPGVSQHGPRCRDAGARKARRAPTSARRTRAVVRVALHSRPGKLLRTVQ
jgi:hypothetical protein